ncbi:MAG: DMT family transporter [Kiloniellales bacterium]|nr:DMT family transporter [Kiloniellales bacterium]
MSEGPAGSTSLPGPAGGLLLPQGAVALASLLWGLWWIPVRGLEQLGLNGNWVSVAVYGFGAVALLPFMLPGLRRLRQNAGTLAAAGITCGAALAFWNHALLVGEVVRVTLLFYLAPVWATILAAVFLGERITLRRGLSIALGLSGAATVLGFLDQGLHLPRGEADWIAIAAGISFAVATTIIRKAGAGNSVPQSFATVLGAALVAWALTVFHAGGGALGGPALAVEALPLAAAVGALWLLPALWLVLWGAGRIDPGRVAILLLLEIVTAAVSAALLTAEPFGAREAAGCLLILGAGLVEAMAGRPWAPGVLLRLRRR